MDQMQNQIRYLSDEDTDYALLENAIAKGQLGDLIDYGRVRAEQQSPPSVSDYIESVGGNIDYSAAQKAFDNDAQARAALPTRFDSPGQFSLLTSLITDVFAAAKLRGIEIGDLPKIATLPTGQIKACALRLDGASCAFLLFDSELLTFCNLFAKAWVLCIPKEEIEGERFTLDLSYQMLERYLSSDGEEGIRRFQEVLSAITKKGSPTLAPSYAPPSSIVFPTERIRNVMERLVVGHELAHYVHGDIDVALSRIIRIASEPGRENLPEAHLQEHLADAAGTLLALDCEYHDGTHFSFAYLGCECWYASMLLLERFVLFHAGRDTTSWQCPAGLDHPSWFNRRQFIRSAAFEWYQEEELEAILHETITFMDCLIDHIWNRLTAESSSKPLM